MVKHLTRREFLLWCSLTGITLAGCGRDPHNANVPLPLEASENGTEIGNGIREAEQTVTLYDTYAMALYMDGSLGPKTGIVKVEYILANVPVELEFWHGHGGKAHRYTLLPEHFDLMKALKKVTLETTKVDSHAHKLFVDMGNPKWRVPGAQPVPVPLTRKV